MTQPSSIKKYLVNSIPVTALLIASVGMVSQANAVDIRQSQIDACTADLVNYKITDRDSANRLCTCDIDVQASMTIGQVWEIQSYIASDKDPSALPHFVKMQQDSMKCQDGITLNPPQVPQQ